MPPDIGDTLRYLTVIVLTVLSLAAAPSALADDFSYKNPWKPTKNAEKIPDSLYRGWHYNPKYEDFRKCVYARESGGNFKANGTGGSGAAQFIQSTWDTYVVKVDPGYVGVRPHKAPPYLQEEVFWLVLNPYAKKPGMEGKHHWSASHAHKAGFSGVKDC